MTLLIFLGTTKTALPLLKKLPMSQLFWMMRFTSMAMATFLIGLLDWDRVKKNILHICLVIVLIEGLYTFNVIHVSQPAPRIAQDLSIAVELADQRIAMLDQSTYDSDPSYFFYIQ